MGQTLYWDPFRCDKLFEPHIRRRRLPLEAR